MRIRHATPDEMEALAEFAVTDPVGFVSADQFRQEAAAGRVRHEWTWFARDGIRIVGRAVWWGRGDSEQPLSLDCLHVLAEVPDRASVAAELLSRAHAELNAQPEYQLILPTGRHRSDLAVTEAVAWRSDAARMAGLSDVVERLRFEWTPTSGLPAASQRLVFRPGTDEEFLAVLRRVAVGSLDVVTQRDLGALGSDAQARSDLEFYRSCPGERSWWRVAETTDGELVGLAIPSATPYHPNVGYLGVVPEQRGHGYVNDVLGEITRLHAAEGANRITATTDAANTPMAAAFDRANFHVTEVRIVFTAPPD